MVSASSPHLLAGFSAWIARTEAVRGAILFGSRARAAGTTAAADAWSDLDLQLITTAPDQIIATDWAREMAGAEYCMHVLRAATGGTQKLTVIFTEGEADLVLVRTGRMRAAGWAMRLGLHRHVGTVADPLNILATIMGGGYRFLKGESRWGPLYARIVAEMPGYRLNDEAVRRLADSFLCDLLWVLQKLERGEKIAAQRTLHRAMHETNVVLLHELRLRRGDATYQQARRVEQLSTPGQLHALKISAHLDHAELAAAAWQLAEGLKALMSELVPAWRVPPGMAALLARCPLTPAK